MTGRLDLGCDIGEHELDALEAGDGLPELLPFLHVVERVVESALGDAKRLGADAGPGSIQHRERDLEAGAFFAQAVGGRDLDVLEHDLCRGRAADPKLVLELLHGPRSRLALEDERRDASMLSVGIGLRYAAQGARDAA